MENGVFKEEDIPSSSVGSIAMSIVSDVQPLEVEFKGFLKGTATAVMLNGTDSLRVTPTETLLTLPVVVQYGKLPYLLSRDASF